MRVATMRVVYSALIAVLAALVLGTVLTACATGPSAVGPGDRLDLGAPGEALRLEAGVLYYPACGTEVLEWDGAGWYPYQPANVEELPTDPVGAFGAAASAATTAAVTAVAYVPSVAAPGPGDDRGTLVVFEGAVAYWESDSGELSTWLTRQPLEYRWVC